MSELKCSNLKVAHWYENICCRKVVINDNMKLWADESSGGTENKRNR